MASLGSAVIGGVFGCCGALFLKHLPLRDSPSLEFACLCLLAYLYSLHHKRSYHAIPRPYLLAEGMDLSGIMAILFGGIAHAHYTQYNLSPSTQGALLHVSYASLWTSDSQSNVSGNGNSCGNSSISLYWLIFRLCMILKQIRNGTFYLPVTVWTCASVHKVVLHHSLQISSNTISLILCLLARALNIFPLSAWINFRRKTKITFKMQVRFQKHTDSQWYLADHVVQWSSRSDCVCSCTPFTTRVISVNVMGLRSVLILPRHDTRNVIITTTLLIVVFTIVIFGGTTVPLLNCLQSRRK